MAKPLPSAVETGSPEALAPVILISTAWWITWRNDKLQKRDAEHLGKPFLQFIKLTLGHLPRMPNGISILGIDVPL
jgi:hypothetical protein